MTVASFRLMRRSRGVTRRGVEAHSADPIRVSEAIVTDVMEKLALREAGRAFADFQRGEIGPACLVSNFLPDVHRISHRTLFLHGRGDRLVPQSGIEAAADRMPDATLNLMEAGHWPMRERPEEFNAAVAAFLEQQSGIDRPNTV
ncbi:alpha/beta fold hydrolase [Aliiruegeria haliotis]|nr:alpha/beta hydrolase [Aliiruegeria haliotis]